MSHPASGSDNDAVLSSIRRLVLNKQDERDVVRGDTSPDPLVLTEALRVDMDGRGSDAFGVSKPSAAGGGATLDWQEERDLDVTEAVAAPFEDDARRDVANGQANSDVADSVVDEEFLRDIVSEIVREELQGDLGERITRNVRKLVRREINRALASRDFD